MPRTKKPAKRGRPKGKTTGYTVAGLHLHENEHRAKFGKLHSAPPGAAFAHQLWIQRNPQKASLAVRLRAEQEKKSPGEMLAIVREEGRANLTSADLQPMLAAIDARDPQFFRDAADQLEIIRSDGTLICDDPQEAALASHAVQVREKQVLEGNMMAHRYTYAEMLDAVDWRGWHTQAPSERNLKRLCQKLDLPMQRGRSRK